MSLLDRILGNNEPQQPKRAAWDLTGIQPEVLPQGMKIGYNLQPVNTIGRPQYPQTNSEALLNAYQRNEIVYAAVDIKCTAAMDPRLIVQVRTKDGGWQEEPGHPLRWLMAKPNIYLDEAGMLRAYISSRDTTGIFAAEIVRAGGGTTGLPVELHPLNPTKIAPVPRRDGKVDWQFKDGSDTVIIPAENILVSRIWNPASKWTPLAPLAVCLGSVDADTAQTDYMRAFFNNGGVPSGIIKIQGRTLTKEDAEQFLAQWRDKYSRAYGRQHDPAVFDQNADYQRIGANLDELESEALRKFTETRIAMTLKVPPLIIYSYAGLEQATYSNLQEAWRSFGDYTLSPLLKEYRNWLMKTLLLEFVSEDLVMGERIRLSWDMSEVKWMEENVDALHARARANLLAGGWTLNQFLAATGQPPDKAGDYYLRSVAVVAVAKDTPPDELVALPAGTDAAKSRELKAGTPTEVKASRANIENKMKLKLQRYLMKDFTRVAERVAKAA